MLNAMPAGRPPYPYDAEVADWICEQIATSEMGLEQVLEERKTLGLKALSSTTIYKWLIKNAEFAENYSRARKMQAELLHDRAQLVAQQVLIGHTTKVTPKGTETTTGDNVERSKLIVSTMLKRASQLDAKKYGDKQQVEHSGELGIKTILVPVPSKCGAEKPPAKPEFEG